MTQFGTILIFLTLLGVSLWSWTASTHSYTISQVTGYKAVPVEMSVEEKMSRAMATGRHPDEMNICIPSPIIEHETKYHPAVIVRSAILLIFCLTSFIVMLATLFRWHHPVLTTISVINAFAIPLGMIQTRSYQLLTHPESN